MHDPFPFLYDDVLNPYRQPIFTEEEIPEMVAIIVAVGMFLLFRAPIPSLVP